ncbi:MAG: NADP-dependent oxidoreductase [Planctomycetota bacterium]
MADIQSREIRLIKRPTATPTDENFETATVSIPEPSEGQIRVRNLFLSVDPYMRGRMRDAESYVAPFSLGAALEGGAVGQVIDSKNPKFDAGDYVLSMNGWREYWVADGKGITKLDPRIAPLPAFLGVLGMPGLTAYAGLLKVGEPKEGETVFVSGAAGAVGSAVCQIAKIKGCKVAGSAGSDEKVRWLREECGVDAFNYKKESNLVAAMRRVCPNGIDVCFENVGGAHLESALLVMRPFGRVAVCGLIDQYNNAAPSPGPSTFFSVLTKRLRIQGFIVTDFTGLMPEFHRDMGQWIKEGKLKYLETMVEGIENTQRAFLGLFHGDNIGKMLVKLPGA